MNKIEFKEKMSVLLEKSKQADDRNEGTPFILEQCHIKADELMCELLNDLGFEDGVNLFKEMDKYYI